MTKNWEENDYYDSDEDSFLDRTGERGSLLQYHSTSLCYDASLSLSLSLSLCSGGKETSTDEEAGEVKRPG